MERYDTPTPLDLLQRTSLKSTISIRNLITMYYFEHGKNFVFHGEKHNFWEMLYVDRGEVEVQAGDKVHVLRQGAVIFHKPNEFHKFHAVRGIAPNVVVLTFDCHSPAMRRFEERMLLLDDEERNFLARILSEGRSAFEFPFRHPLRRRRDAAAGCEQLLRNYLEILLLQLLRKLEPAGHAASPLSSAAQERSGARLVDSICRYLEDHLRDKPSVPDIAQSFYLSVPRLQRLFRKHAGCSIKSYIVDQQIRHAKICIREETYNYTEIAALLGFSSVHYFSRAFKKAVGMSPSEYARSVKARMGD